MWSLGEQAATEYGVRQANKKYKATQHEKD